MYIIVHSINGPYTKLLTSNILSSEVVKLYTTDYNSC